MPGSVMIVVMADTKKARALAKRVAISGDEYDCPSGLQAASSKANAN